jgi:hypothetical protein
MGQDVTQHLMGLSPPPCILQNQTPPMIVDNPPFFDLLDRPKAAEADEIIV